MRTVITTKGIRPESRSTHWHQTIAATYFPLDLKFRNPDSFNGEITGWRLGSVSLSRLRSEALLYRRLPKHLTCENSEELLITIPTVSDVEFAQCGREVRAGPGSFILERSYEPYDFSHSQTAELWVMKIGTAALEPTPGRRLYDRFCVFFPGATANLSGRAFRHLAGLAGASPREIARSLPEPAWNYEP